MDFTTTPTSPAPAPCGLVRPPVDWSGPLESGPAPWGLGWSRAMSRNVPSYPEGWCSLGEKNHRKNNPLPVDAAEVCLSLKSLKDGVVANKLLFFVWSPTVCSDMSLLPCLHCLWKIPSITYHLILNNLSALFIEQRLTSLVKGLIMIIFYGPFIVFCGFSLGYSHACTYTYT